MDPSTWIEASVSLFRWRNSAQKSNLYADGTLHQGNFVWKHSTLIYTGKDAFDSKGIINLKACYRINKNTYLILNIVRRRNL